MIARPYRKSIQSEFDNPTPIPDEYDPMTVSFEDKWTFEIIKNAYEGNRKRSMTEMLFCMLRAGR